ncbi:MAG: hypothetical protein LBH06_00500 [Rikenellaceae bacterium]|nr:hypothetical protein [Rikenellaceae bacterium]
MATFRYCIRSTKRNKLAKIQLLFTVRRGNQFYADSGFLVLTDAWSDKMQSIKPRYAFTDNFTAKMGAGLVARLADLRSFILRAMSEDAAGEMTKSKRDDQIQVG